MLEDAVRQMKNKAVAVEEEIVTEMNLPLDAYIPDTYIEDSTQKLLTYKRLSKIRTEADLRDMEDELKDRFGDIPQPLANLLDIISLKCILSQAKIRKIEYADKHLILHVTEKTPIEMKKLLSLVKEKGKIKLLPDGRIIIHSESRTSGLVALAKNVLMELIPV
jgi:transcription-repair coupling factor (superfamily II helicase)